MARVLLFRSLERRTVHDGERDDRGAQQGDRAAEDGGDVTAREALGACEHQRANAARAHRRSDRGTLDTGEGGEAE